MSLQSWFVYCAAVALVIITPGPAALLCMHHGARHGPLPTLAAVLGGSLSSFLLMSVSALGLVELMRASPLAFDLLRGLGVAYLLLLGVSLWRAGRSGARSRAAGSAERSPAPLRRLFRDGFLVGIGNPKDLLFFGALFPQFLDPQRPCLPQLAVLFGTWLVVDGVAMSAYATAGQWLRRTATIRRGA